MLLTFIESLYTAAVARRRERCLQNAWRAPEGVRVVSVGNITMGGTGKTPAVQWLARHLAQYGKVAVVGRGYRGTLSKEGAIVSDGKSTFYGAAAVGDEAVLHARSLEGVAVAIGRDRVQAVRRVIERFHPQFIVLDDAFQYWSLARDCDIVLLDAMLPFGNGHTLPLGKLRELPPALARANIIALTRCSNATPAGLERTRNQIAQHSELMPFLSDHHPLDLRNENNGDLENLDYLHGKKVLSISAIANNASWEKSLHAQGAQIVEKMARRDHHHWGKAEIKRAALQAHKKGATIAITTEKDAVKMNPEWCAPLPLFSLRIAMQWDNKNAFIQQLRQQLEIE